MAINTWLTASRWTYNLTVEILQSGIPAVWKHIASMVMPEVKTLHPEWDSVPYQVKRTAVRDACRALSNVKTFNIELKADQAHGNRADEEFAQLGYRSRKNPKQSCYIPDDAVTEHGVYHTILGPLRMAETIPAGHKECRLVQERGLYWLVVPYPAQCDIETPCGDGVVALDPAFAPFSPTFPKPTAASSATTPSAVSSGSVTGSTTSSAAPSSNPTGASAAKCAPHRRECGSE